MGQLGKEDPKRLTGFGLPQQGVKKRSSLLALGETQSGREYSKRNGVAVPESLYWGRAKS